MRQPPTTFSTALDSPSGRVTVTVDADGALTSVNIGGEPRLTNNTDIPTAAARGLSAAFAQLTQYFAGTRRAFDLPLAPQGTPFQRRVWDELIAIPYGETTSYGELARRLGLPVGAARAVGAANGANPIAIVIPCHRVIGKSGALTGFAAGLDVKRALLELERAICGGGIFAAGS